MQVLPTNKSLAKKRQKFCQEIEIQSIKDNFFVERQKFSQEEIRVLPKDKKFSQEEIGVLPREKNNQEKNKSICFAKR